MTKSEKESTRINLASNQSFKAKRFWRFDLDVNRVIAKPKRLEGLMQEVNMVQS